ncbi:hypothetical protein DSM43518_05010 [Mycobacterium marinum]|nr:hypothetical protein MM1218R_03083 [Mycobacterium marinum]CDM77130.1 hypothetical protein MMARE11_29840 [Mycobacterium marinum E11]AXN50357.1 hypothetical protein CCUG20998_02952 [Mycobacterium marinum]RFZ01466.1 hypothetical protein VIMS_05712 [Mycobacterium marinum]RFZ02525.1 hypothetical protein DSM43518_05010 [Mycobacterium marinum]
MVGGGGAMGRVQAAGDNAAMESFFSLLRKNVLGRRRWETREHLRIAIATWTETHLPPPPSASRSWPVAPVRFEAIMISRATQAA